MSSPAASAPIAVLVLAWDETTPAVRALVEAAEIADPALDSVVVLVPAAPVKEEPALEEPLALADSQLAATLPAGLATPTEHAATAAPLAVGKEMTAAEAVALTGEPVALPPVAAEAAATPAAGRLSPSAERRAWPPVDATPAPGPIGLNALTAAVDTPVVRVLRLSEYSLSALAALAQQALPAPIWLGGPTSMPAAPYLGSSVAVPALAVSSSAASSEGAPYLAVTTHIVADTELAAGQSKALATSEEPATPDYPTTEPPAALAANSATMPTLASPAAVPADSTANPELNELAANNLVVPLLVAATPGQAGWPEALAALQKPAVIEAEPTATSFTAAPDASAGLIQSILPATERPASTPAYAALLPTASQFDAPDLNFQVIQYARFAVPVALAAQPFAVIYAPAWPTWLAAQELRHGTGQPLVLHVATLAAGDEPLDLAAGWAAEIQRQALHRADLILTETLALAHRLRRELNLAAHRVRPVPAADAAAVAQALSTAHVWPAGA